MKKVEIVYNRFFHRGIELEGVTKPVQMAQSLPFRLQKMCEGGGQHWDKECPKYLREKLDKDKLIRAYRYAYRLSAVISWELLSTTVVTLRFFAKQGTEESFYNITVNINIKGGVMLGRITSTEQLFNFVVPDLNDSLPFP
ncbi:hypothetical protein KC865_03740 [Candidatus Kaiserbacteria bacterium]|nr:hypothetical protein [Candidatus Kaiserbacteria bacterium]USN92495.1 MAG: hypothetical protein H6782_01615 [Candidatus Nomurabacteria bacterium]